MDNTFVIDKSHPIQLSPELINIITKYLPTHDAYDMLVTHRRIVGLFGYSLLRGHKLIVEIENPEVCPRAIFDCLTALFY